MKYRILLISLSYAFATLPTHAGSDAPRRLLNSDSTPSRSERQVAGSEAMLASIQNLAESLSSLQRNELVRRSTHWTADNTDLAALETRMLSDAKEVLGGAQYKELEHILDQAIASAYYPGACLLGANAGVIASVLVALLCPSPDATEATYYAYAASIYAGQCAIEGAASCESAATYAGTSAYVWGLITQAGCYAAAAPTAILGATYVSCGSL